MWPIKKSKGSFSERVEEETEEELDNPAAPGKLPWLRSG